MQFKQNGNAVADGNDDSKAKIDFTIHFCTFFCRILEQKTTKSKFDVFIYVVVSRSNSIKSLLFYAKFFPFSIESCILFPILAMLCQIAANLYKFSTQLSTHRQNDASSIESLCIFSFLICIM